MILSIQAGSGKIEMKLNDVQFVRVDSDIADNLIDKAESADSVLAKIKKQRLPTCSNRWLTANITC
jgi:hypothetical protein